MLLTPRAVGPPTLAALLLCGCSHLHVDLPPSPSSPLALPSSTVVAASLRTPVCFDSGWLSRGAHTHHWLDGGSMVDILQMVEGFFTVALFCPFLDLLVCYHTLGLSALCSHLLAPQGSLLVDDLPLLALLLCAICYQVCSISDLPLFALCLCAMGHQVDQDLSCLHCGPSRSHVSGPTTSSQDL